MSAYKISSQITDALSYLRLSDNEKSSSQNESSHRFESEHFYELNSKRDIKYACKDDRTFENTLFIFTQQWVGIRQACGAFPAAKLAIDGHHKWSTSDIIEISNLIQNNKINKIISHGMAPSTKYLLSGLKNANPEIEILSVWHGTMAGWAFEHELRLFKDIVDLVERNIVKKIGFLRRGMEIVHNNTWKGTLLNISPSVESYRLNKAFSQKPINCLFASWNNQWKNMYTNLVGASNSKNVGKIFCYQKVEGGLIEKISYEKHDNFDDHLTRLSLADLCLNVSINDCQPMTELESIAVGTPSLRPNLDHGIKDFLEYDKLFTINEYLNPQSITRQIDLLCSEEPSYIQEVVNDYCKKLKDISFKRYAEFMND